MEPSATYRGLLSGVLKDIGAQTLLAQSGGEALASLQHCMPDAICVAHELGDMQSGQFIRALNAHGVSNTTPKFLITSRCGEAFKRSSFDAGYTDVLDRADIDTIRRGLLRLVSHASEVLSARVLYVEDVMSTAAYMMTLLTDLGLSVDHVQTGESALQRLERQQYDLVITDLVLAGAMSGLSLVASIREGDKRHRSVPILAVSGWNDPSRQVYVLRQGASDFVSKPINTADFMARVVNLIQSKKRFDATLAVQFDLQHKATTDQLTGLCNRHSLYDLGEQIIKAADQAGDIVSMLLVDIDYFKKINDQHGHDVGDAVLKAIGEILRKQCRHGDLAARFGGEEFVILMRACDGRVAVDRAEHLRLEIAGMRTSGVSVTASIGVATTSQEGHTSLGSLFKAADLALYDAKDTGRNRVRRHDAD